MEIIPQNNLFGFLMTLPDIHTFELKIESKNAKGYTSVLLTHRSGKHSHSKEETF